MTALLRRLLMVVGRGVSSLGSGFRVLTIGHPFHVELDQPADEVLAWLSRHTTSPFDAGIQVLFPTPGVSVVLIGQVKGKRVRLHPPFTRWIERKMVLNFHGTIEPTDPGHTELSGRIWIGWPFLMILLLWIALMFFVMSGIGSDATSWLLLGAALVYQLIATASAATTVRDELPRRILEGLETAG